MKLAALLHKETYLTYIRSIVWSEQGITFIVTVSSVKSRLYLIQLNSLLISPDAQFFLSIAGMENKAYLL